MNAIDTPRVGRASTSGSPIIGLAKRWAAGTALGVLLVVLAHVLAGEFSGPLVVTGVGTVTLGSVVGFTVLGGTVGAVLAYVIGRFTRNPRPTYVAVTLIALAGYAMVPFTAAESLGTAVWLNVFHLVVAIPVIALFTRYLPRGRTSGEA